MSCADRMCAMTLVGGSTGPIFRCFPQMHESRACFPKGVVILSEFNLKRRKCMMRMGLVVTILSGLMLLAACSDPAADKSRAVTGEATQVSPSPQTAGSAKYQITPQNSKIEFVGSKVTGSHNGSFGNFAGQIEYGGTPETSRVNITIETNSITADDANLTKHLKTAD